MRAGPPVERVDRDTQRAVPSELEVPVDAPPSDPLVPASPDGPPGAWFNRTVVGAGVTSALGDLCYETATVLLPGFLAVLGLPAAVLGIIEGLADAVASFTKLASGYIADRVGHRKALVALGYGLTPVGQALVALAAGWPLVLVGRLVSWFGKRLRGPLRDAIVVQAVSARTRGRAFGFHRAMDTLGAVKGVAKLAASSFVGIVWTVVSPVAAFAMAAVLMGAGTVALRGLRAG